MPRAPHTVAHDLPDEIDFLRRQDEAQSRIMEIVDMPDRLAQDRLMFMRQNGGKIPTGRRRNEFAALTDEEAKRIEAAPSSMMLIVSREPLNRIELEYRRRIDSMSISERVQRAEALLSWARGFIARQILAEQGPLSDDRLKWEVALRQYGADPATRALIERMSVRARG